VRQVQLLCIILCGMYLAGCASIEQRPTFLENRVVCTLAQDKAFVVSRWGPVGISSEVAEKDRAVICK
jgi:hypothetical protein